MRLVANNVRSYTVPDSGHYPAEEQPHALAAELLSFLGSVS
jgi:pimeloyl-ACP methyl ester carboxylesterase